MFATDCTCTDYKVILVAALQYWCHIAVLKSLQLQSIAGIDR